MTMTIDGTSGATFPDNSVQAKSQTGPAFSAYLSADQTITSSTWTKLQANTEEFDTNSAYDNATNYRFLPTVAGYYQVSGALKCASSGGATTTQIAIYKNGSSFKANSLAPSGAPNPSWATISALVYLNGSTDYVELWGNVALSGSGFAFGSGANGSVFQASFVRAA